MGEIADMMLDGTLCEGCGCDLPGAAPGHPRYCHDCRRHRAPVSPQSTKTRCTVCGRRVSRTGLNNHMRDAHPKKDHWHG